MDRKEFRKGTKVEIMKRSQECIEKIIKDNLNYTMFCDWYVETFGLTKHAAYKEWVKSWNIIKSRFELEKDQLVNKHVYNLYDLFKQAVEVGDFSTSRHILNDIAKYQGIDVADKVNVKHEGEIKIIFGDEE